MAGNDARVVVSLTLGAEEGERVLEAADADGDGRVSEAEADAHLAQWAAGLRTELPVSVDGAAVELAWGEGWFEPIGEVREVPVTLELVAHLALDGEQTVALEDRMVRREVFDRTDVAFRAREGAELLASGAEAEPSEPIPDLAYGPTFRGGEPVTLTAVVRTPERPPEVPWIGLGIAGGLVAVLGAVWIWRRKR
ncbi:MAG TPA: hypothetical protein RMH99_02495 [Sandaracinaceae bacterium LLY-WYZ-13_1]|nr:hypothetical protein [Sandaracinaceae bacterium LLY-WYZ-13_1]